MTKGSSGLGTAVVLAALAVLVGAGPTTAGTTIVVTNTADELAIDGNCSLREAIQAANTDSAVDGCAAGSGADTITLAAATYALTLSGGDDTNAKGDLDVMAPVTIQGAGQASTVIYGSYDRSFDILGTVATITGMRISNGPSGIRNTGSLTLTNSTLSLNDGTGYGGGLDSEGAASSATIRNSTITANTAEAGGGLYVTGALDAADVTISGNDAYSAGAGVVVAAPTGTSVSLVRATIANNSFGQTLMGHGAGVDVAGPLSIKQSTISDHLAKDPISDPTVYFPGAGIYVEPNGVLTLSQSTVRNNTGLDGDGIYNNGSTTVVNSTISTNGSNVSAGKGGGIYNAAGHTLSLSNATLANNISTNSTGGGNLYNAGSGTAKNTIIAVAFGGGDCETTLTPSPLVSQGHNMVDGLYCLTSNPTDLGGDPLFGPLQDNGGPTWTHALQSGSPAIDAGAGCESADQRGFVRPQGAACDIGAYELLQPFTLAIAKAGTGSGTVTSAPAGIDCGSDCSEVYAGTIVTLTATPAAGSVFAGWSGACTGTGTCSVTMTAARSATATFAVAPPPPPPPPPPTKCHVPKVTGKKLAVARRAITKGRCRVGKIARRYSKTVKRGRVISERPKAGRVLARGARVNLVLSRGRPHR